MDDFEKFYNKALKFLSFRPRSEKEIIDKLKSKKASEDIIKKIIEKLKEYKFIDDLEFAKAWVNSRIKTNQRGWRLIQSELKLKGISKEIIDNIYDSGKVINELEMAKKLVEKKVPRYRNLPKQKVYQRLGRLLLSKGFNWDIIKQSIDEALGKVYNNPKKTLD